MVWIIRGGKGKGKGLEKNTQMVGKIPPLPPSKLNLAHAHERINVFSSAATSIFTSLHVQIRICMCVRRGEVRSELKTDAGTQIQMQVSSEVDFSAPLVSLLSGNYTANSKDD